MDKDLQLITYAPLSADVLLGENKLELSCSDQQCLKLWITSDELSSSRNSVEWTHI